MTAAQEDKSSVRSKLLATLLVAALLVVGSVVLVLWQQVEAARRAAMLEAEHRATEIAAEISGIGMADKPMLQRRVAELVAHGRRDLFVVDTGKQVVADVETDEIGTLFSGDADKSIDRTLSDGQTRSFTENQKSPRRVALQMVVPIYGDAEKRQGAILGAVVLEYTPMYDALMTEARGGFYVVGALGVLFVLLVTVFGYRIASDISQPLMKLKQCVEALAAGNYDVRANETSNDDFGALGAAFNRMATDLQTTHSKVVESQRDLEHRVASRTTELRLAEEAQRHSVAELRLVTEHIPVALAYVDRDLRYRYHNKRYATFARRRSDEIDERSVVDVWGASAYEVFEPRIDKALSGHQVSGEHSGARVDGKQQHLHTTLVPRIGSDGVAVGFYVMVQDVTERRITEEALKQSNEALSRMNERLQEAQNQLLQADKMASIGQLASGVAHEINNPIGYVYSNFGTLDGYLSNIFELLERYRIATEGVADAAMRTALQSAREQADLDFVKADVVALMSESMEGIKRVMQIVRDLKNFSRAAGDEAWQWADLHLGIDSTISVVWNELKYKAEVCKNYGDLPLVQCRPSQLNQVFLNLLVNGADAIKRRGTISISSGVDGDDVWIEFADTGDGIRPEHVHRIFDPFFTTKPVGKGTGLGLSVAYGIVKAHNGRIDVRTEVGKGTAFRVWLPIRQDAPADAT